MNAPASGADILPNAEAMLEEIEKKQREAYGKIKMKIFIEIDSLLNRNKE